VLRRPIEEIMIGVDEKNGFFRRGFGHRL
jgi:hypothetical protein